MWYFREFGKRKMSYWAPFYKQVAHKDSTSARLQSLCVRLFVQPQQLARLDAIGLEGLVRIHNEKTFSDFNYCHPDHGSYRFSHGDFYHRDGI